MKTPQSYFEHKRQAENKPQIGGTQVEQVVTTPPLNENVPRTRKICATADFRNSLSDNDMVTVGMLRNIFGNGNATDIIAAGKTGWNLSCGIGGASSVGNLYNYINQRLPNQNQPMRNISIVSCGNIRVQNQFWRDADNIAFARISIYSYWGTDAFKATLLAHEYSNDGNHRFFFGVMRNNNTIDWKEIATWEKVQAYIQEREEALWTEVQQYVNDQIQEHTKQLHSNSIVLGA